jgi:iron complex outermembrane receptor protein
VPTTPVVENVGLGLGNPLKLRANGGLTWQRDHWTLGWSVRYFDSYLVADPTATGSATLILNQGSPRVPSQVYHDFFATYKFSPHAENKGRLKMLDRLELQVGVKNVFNAKPPLDAAAQFPLGYSTYGDPRLAEYYFSAKKSF